MIIHLQKMSLIAAVLAAMSTLSLPSLADQLLTENESLRLGLERPEITDLARGRIGEAAANAAEAGLWANPTLEYSRDNGRNGANSEEQIWRLSQPVDLAGRRGLKRQAGEQRVTAAEADSQMFRSERTSEIRHNFYQLLRRERQLAAIIAWAGRFAASERIVGKLRAAGEVSGYDLRRLARERQSAEAKRAETQADVERTREQFAALLGINASAWDSLSGRLLPVPPLALEPLLARLDSRPDLAALKARVAAAELDGRAAARGWIPEVTLGVGTRRTEDSFGRQSATLISVSVPLPLFDRQQASERRAAAQAASARAEYGLAHSRAEGQLRGLQRQTTQLIAAAERYRNEAVTPSAELVRIAESAYRAGESTVLELLDAYKGALEAETIALDLEWKAREAGIELDQLTGSHPE